MARPAAPSSSPTNTSVILSEAKNLFALLSGLTAKERFAFGEKRRAYKKRTLVIEELVEDANGRRKLVYTRKGIKIGELRLP